MPAAMDRRPRLASARTAAFIALVCGLVGLLPPPVLADAQADPCSPPRVAFVIANSGYARLAKLHTPLSDGKLLAGALRKHRFTVIEGYDLTREEMLALLGGNRPLVDRAEAVLVYYAGHGFQSRGMDYTVPVDASFDDAADVATEAVPLAELVALLDDPDRPLFVFHDASRDNPFGSDRGGAGPMPFPAGTNVLTGFATRPGAATTDGGGANSPFATALAHALDIEGLSIAEFHMKVRDETMALTHGRQMPWTNQSLTRDFVLFPPAGAGRGTEPGTCP